MLGGGLGGPAVSMPHGLRPASLQLPRGGAAARKKVSGTPSARDACIPQEMQLPHIRAHFSCYWIPVRSRLGLMGCARLRS